MKPHELRVGAIVPAYNVECCMRVSPLSGNRWLGGEVPPLAKLHFQ